MFFFTECYGSGKDVRDGATSFSKLRETHRALVFEELKCRGVHFQDGEKAKQLALVLKSDEKSRMGLQEPPISKFVSVQGLAETDL